MLINFSLENWMSFRDKVEFSMVASRERQHGDRVPRVRKYQMRVLPITAIYGGNASGKTNFFKALSFARRLVIRGTQPDRAIPVEPFLLGTSDDKPSRFSFELLMDETIYEFSFAVTRKAVLEEKLVVSKSTSEKVLYHRKDGKPNFDSSLAKDKFLEFSFRGTRDNQLFLTNTIDQNVDTFRPVYNWFKRKLKLIAPDERFGSFPYFLDEEAPLYGPMSEILTRLDTGITRLSGEEVPFEHIPLSASQKVVLQEAIKEGMVAPLPLNWSSERFAVTRKGGKLMGQKLVTWHQKADGTEVKFEIDQESDGTKRTIDLLPAFLHMCLPEPKVYVIDEIDRSLHTLLIQGLLEMYLNSCYPKTRNQLLLTAHDTLLLDQQLLRRDEMWVAERDNAGASRLFSFSQFEDLRYDTDLRRSYRQGRLGGIPHIWVNNAWPQTQVAEESGEYG